MKKIIIIVVIISAIIILLGDYINSLLVSVGSTLPVIMQPLQIFVTFYSFVFDVIFSNYYLSLFVNIIIVLFVFSLLIKFLVGLPAGIREFSETQKQKQRLKEKEKKSKASAEARYQSYKTSRKSHRGDYTETIKDYEVGK